MKNQLKLCLAFGLFLALVTIAGWFAGGWYMFAEPAPQQPVGPPALSATLDG